MRYDVSVLHVNAIVFRLLNEAQKKLVSAYSSGKKLLSIFIPEYY